MKRFLNMDSINVSKRQPIKFIKLFNIKCPNLQFKNIHVYKSSLEN